jgi:hypothetical protein
MNLLRHCLFFIVVFASKIVLGQTSWPSDLITVPEKTEFERTSTHSDVIRFLDHLQSRSKEIKVISMGKSLEGKMIPVAVLSSPAVDNAADARSTGKLIVYIQGNIHAGEVEGKEATLMCMREILLGDKHNLLDNQIILFAPIYNTDSNDNMEAGRRPSQEDSPVEIGLRENSAGLDLNRDGVKMEALETQGLFSNIISQWDPQVFVDLHTTNGTWHAYSLTWAPAYHTLGDSATYNYTVEMLRSISATAHTKYGLAFGPYGEYRLEEGWPPKNFYTYNHHPRYLVNNFGLRNRVAILSEAFSHERFYQRINSTYHFVNEILTYTKTHSKEILDLSKKSRENTIRDVIEHAGKIRKGVRFQMVSEETLNDFKTYDYVRSEKADGGSEWIRIGKVVAYDDVRYHGAFRSTLDATMPSGYVIPAQFSQIVELLKKHGVIVSQLTGSKLFSGELFRIDSLGNSNQKFEGHYMANVSGHFRTAKQRFKKGDYVVDLAQPLANVIFYLLEPQSDDGLINWNFFDLYLEKKGVNNKPVDYPVFKYIK